MSLDDSGHRDRGELLRGHDRHLAAALHQVAQRHIDRMREGWPEQPWAEPRLVVRGCQDYGLGLIRMLSEYHTVAGLEDRLSVRLATDLYAECRRALKRLEAGMQASPDAEDRRWRRWRAGTGRVRG